MKKILCSFLCASALCSLLTLAAASAQSRLAPIDQSFQFQLADDPPPPLPPFPPPPPPGGGDDGEKYA